MTSLVAQYFLNHRLDLKELEWQVEEAAKGGYQGLYAHARAGLLTPYMSDDWWRAMDKMIEVCRRAGIEFWIWDEDYYPSGMAGGRVVWEEPGLLARGLEFTIARVAGEGPFEVDFAPGMLLRAFAVGEGKVQDVTRFCGTRRQRWSARQIIHRAYSPEINRLGHPHWRTSFGDNRFALSWQPPTPGEYALVGVVVKTTTGSHPDILRPESIRRFIELSYEPYFQRYGAEFGKLIKGAFTDEPSPGGPLYPWTPRFPEEFRADHGYDLLDHLAHLALDVDERSAAVRHHYRLTQHRLQCQAYTGQIGRWCEQHGILAVGHLTRTEWLSLVSAWWPNELRCYKAMHIPSADPLGATCAWAEATAYHTGLKVASSAAHLFGRAQAGSDALAVIGDEAALRDLKFIFDYQMVLGINHFSVHGLSYSLDGPRKDEVPPSLFYQHTEWKHTRHLLDHVRTTCEALTGGEHLCEMAVLYPSTSLACQARPEADWHRLPDEPLIHALVEQLLSHQRDFDFIDEVTLQEALDEEGNLTTPEPYRVILLPHLRYIDERTAEALLRFAATGARVIAIGTTPKAITRSLEKPLREWAGGMIQRCPSLTDDVLRTLPGVEVSGAGARDVFVLRRRVGGERRMFVLNRREQAFDGQVDGCPVSVPPRGSVLVTANLPLRKAEREVPSCLADLSAGWDVTFEPNQLPLNFWHASASDRARLEAAPTNAPGFDLMARQADPNGEGDGRVCYVCRFMLTGDIPDARLVMDDSAIAGEWDLHVNGVPIKDWKRAVILDCRNLVAQVGHALRSGSTPTLNLVTVETRGPGRGLKEVLCLLGSFTCEYRYGHLSFPFVKGASGSLSLDVLRTWDALGYPTFSGSAVYRRKLAVPASGDYVLDLGRVEDIAAVSLDGRSPIVLAWPPYQCALGRLTPGEHDLTVEVTNAPANRNRAARLPAGLLGPVRLLTLPQRQA